jgi:nifR3 family TIM-barrel protein
MTISERKPPFPLSQDGWRFPFFLAPVAGYSDAAFRSICREKGAALCYTEMISAEALVRGHAKTRTLLARHEAEPDYAIQLFGAKPDILARAAEIVSAYRPVVIDLNCGCPVPKIVRSGAGSALLKNPELIGEIVRAMHSASSVPVSVKIRKGWDEKSVNYLETAQVAIEAGACAITLHARTRAQGYAGQADWDAIRKLVETTRAFSNVFVFGSGDVFSPEQAKAMIAQTGCDGVMIARGAIGNPFIFARLKEESTQAEQIPAHLVARTALRHLERSIRFLGEKTACVEFRKHFCAYTKGYPGGAALRARAVHAETFDAFCQLLEEFAAMHA